MIFIVLDTKVPYRSSERDKNNGVIYKDVCHPITAEFREELYENILEAYKRGKEPALCIHALLQDKSGR